MAHPATVGAVGPGGDPWAPIPPARPAVQSPAAADPWRPVATTAPSNGDPWSPNTDHSPMSPPDMLDDFDAISNRDRASANNNINNNGHRSPDAFDMTGLGESLGGRKKSPHAFLGENSALVNLENLVTATPKPSVAAQSGLFCKKKIKKNLIFFYSFWNSESVWWPAFSAELVPTANTAQAFVKPTESAESGDARRCPPRAPQPLTQPFPFLTDKYILRENAERVPNLTSSVQIILGAAF